MGQAKIRGTREQRVAAAEEREHIAKLGSALAAMRKREALQQAALDDMRDPPARVVVIGGVTPRMRLALAGRVMADMIDRVGTVNQSAATATSVGDAQ